MSAGVHRYMVFIDATNLLAELGKDDGFRLDPHRPIKEAFEYAVGAAEHAIEKARPKAWRATDVHPQVLIRVYWVGSYQGNDMDRGKYEDAARDAGLEPVLLQKLASKGREKGVDMALAIRMLTNAYHGNFDTGILIAGDSDYCDLVKETMRYGPRVLGSFIDADPPMARDLRRALDGFVPLPRSTGQRPDHYKNLRDAVMKQGKK